MANSLTSSRSSARGARPRRARWPWLLLLLAVLAVAAIYVGKPLQGYAVTGASYGARVACSCRFAGGRSLGDCRKDFETGMDLISLSEDRARKSVTARFPLLATQTATYREGWGCVLEPLSD
jgi:hypothetical protein